MMSVEEYALDVNKSVEEIIKKAKELGYDVNSKDDMLSDDAIVELDIITANSEEEEENTYLEETTEEKDYDLEDELDNKAEVMASASNIKYKDNSSKMKKKSNKDLKKSKKEMYKNKEKLTSNTAEIAENEIVFKEGTTVSEFSKLLDVPANDIIKKLIEVGVMASLNNSIPFETAELIASEYGKTLKTFESQDKTNFEKLEIIDDEKDLQMRPPVVTIMGHVDHGKTSLLDYIRNSSITDGEFGGITQHIGAYQIKRNENKITFIDTPGHAAFTEMRARGASVTDIVIIIVAADDGVMPQTEEAIDHAKAAGVPIIVAINKIDKPGANPEKVMTEMAQRGLTPEAWGGDTIYNNISAVTGEGIDALLDSIQLVSEMAELKANPNRYAMGTVIESKLDKHEGSTVTLLVQNGTLRLGDPIVVGTTYGKVRTLKNDQRKEVVEALPSTPVEITGLNDVPTAGDRFMAYESEKEARSIAEERLTRQREEDLKSKSVVSLDDLFSRIEQGSKEINIVLKTDVKGTEEAIKSELTKIDVEGVKINVIRSGVGTVTESDVVLANASDAIIIGFNVRPTAKTMDVAKDYNVDIRLYNIIYKVVEELESAMKGMLDPEYEEKVTGSAEVRKLFKYSKVGTIAGCNVINGLIKSKSKARLIRDGVVIYDGEIGSLQIETNSVKEVKKGFDCGITLDKYNDIKEKDVIEAYEMVEIKN